jgi:hypothetical protein
VGTSSKEVVTSDRYTSGTKKEDADVESKLYNPIDNIVLL